MSKNILIRADSSATIGIGHIMRDLVLAKQFKDDSVIFSTRELEGNINQKIKDDGFEVDILNSDDIEELDKLIKKFGIDLLVIDHYGINYEDEKELKAHNPTLKILSFDDTYEKHYCDVLLNHNISANESRYKDLVPEFCELRCGGKYTLIREEFYEAKKLPKTKNEKFTIFVAMGGADTLNITQKALEVLEEFDLKANVLTSSANKNIHNLQKYCKEKDWIDLHIDSNKVARLMRESDFAIVTPSVILHEMMFMELPFLAIKTADNQEDMFGFLKREGYLVLEGFDGELLKRHIKKIDSERIEMISFTDLTDEEKKMILQWRNHKDIRKWMFSKDVIEEDDHFKYINSLKDRDDRVYFLVKRDNEAVGVIDFTNIDAVKRSADIGLYAKPNLKGIGRVLMDKIVDHGFNTLGLKKLYSKVYIDNGSAIKLYKKFGFITKDLKRDVIVMELSHENI